MRRCVCGGGFSSRGGFFGGTGFGGTGSGGTGSERTGSERTGSERTGSERTGSERTGSERTGSERTGSEAICSRDSGSGILSTVSWRFRWVAGASIARGTKSRKDI